jgi:hypothetical protein
MLKTVYEAYRISAIDADVQMSAHNTKGAYQLLPIKFFCRTRSAWLIMA